MVQIEAAVSMVSAEGKVGNLSIEKDSMMLGLSKSKSNPA
jgi:hypothetical protein